MEQRSRGELEPGAGEGEAAAELLLPPCGAWDYPLCRTEKVRRVLSLYEAELQQREEELLGLRVPGTAARKRSGTGVAAARRGLSATGPAERCPSASSAAAPCGGRASMARAMQPALARTAPAEAPAQEPGARVAAMRWGAGQGVWWLRFACDGGGVDEGTASGELLLEEGEHVRLVRGRADAKDGRLADWLTLVTSRLRSVTLGEQHGRAIPGFSFIAAPGHEICGLEVDGDGSLRGVVQRQLSVSEDAPSDAAWPRELCGHLPLSQLGRPCLRHLQRSASAMGAVA